LVHKVRGDRSPYIEVHKTCRQSGKGEVIQMVKVMLLAVDVGPCKNLGLVGKALEERGCAVTRCLGYGRPDTISTNIDAVLNEVRRQDVLVTGMSSSPELAEVEMRALRAARGYCARALFADTFSVVGRPWFEDSRSEVDLVIVPDEDEIRAVTGSTGCFFAGGVPLWEQFACKPGEREEYRGRLDVSKDVFLAMLVGGKKTEINLELFATASEQVRKAACRQACDFRVVLSIHPGDRTDPSAYQGLGEMSLLGASETLKASDLLICSYSTVSIEAACIGVPAIDYLTVAARNRFLKNTGTADWPPIVRGLTDAAYVPDQLARMIGGVLVESGDLRQPRYPVNPGAAKRIAERILDMKCD